MKFHKFPKKSLGQNFLIDQNIIKKIIKIGELNNNKVVLEIGPGTGNLTKEILLTYPKKITLIEKDKNLFTKLKYQYKNIDNLNIMNEDILNYISSNILDKKIIVFGNLPYNISTQVLAKLILLDKWPPWYDKLILMFQKEVAERIIAKRESKNYSRLSVLCNWRLKIKKHFDISQNCFFPKPKIESTLLSFEPKNSFAFNIKNPKNLEIVTRTMFSSPRKMINKSLSKLFEKNKSAINDLNIDLNSRPEELSCDTFYKITSIYENYLSNF